MAIIPVDSEIRQIIGNDSEWMVENSRLQDDIIVLTRDTDVWKKGKGFKRFRDLPILLISPNYLDIYNKLVFLEDFGSDITEKLTYLNPSTGKISRDGGTYLAEIIENGATDHSYFGQELCIHGPIQASFGSAIILQIEGFMENYIGSVEQLKSRWLMSTGETVDSDSLTLSYDIPPNIDLIGNSITFYAKIIDPTTNTCSRFATKTINIVPGSEDKVGCVIGSSIEIIDINQISIASIEWDDNIHRSNKRYCMSVFLDNRNIDDYVSISIKYTPTDIKITRLPDNFNVFFVKYPNWSEPIDAVFEITVNDLFGNFDTIEITKHVTP